MPGAFLRTRGPAKTLGIARYGSLEADDIERCVRIVFSRAVAPRTERITQVNGTDMPEDSVKIDDAHSVSQKIGDFEIPVDKLLRLISNDERRQRRKDAVSDTVHIIRQLRMHVLQFCEDKIRIVEVWDVALRYVITGCQVLMQATDEVSCLTGEVQPPRKPLHDT